MANGDEGTFRPTTASVDRRIERLEDAVSHLQDSYNELDRKIDKVDLNQQHLKEILDARLATHSAKIEALSVKIDTAITLKLDGLIDMITKAQIEGAKIMGDINSTPAGRLVSEEIRELKEGREENNLRINKLENKILVFSGGLGVLVLLINLFAPVIQGFFGLPH